MTIIKIKRRKYELDFLVLIAPYTAYVKFPELFYTDIVKVRDPPYRILFRYGGEFQSVYFIKPQTKAGY